MAHAFGMCSVAMWYESVPLEIHTPALTRIADQRTRTNRLRYRPIDTVRIWLRAVESQRYRDIDRENVTHSLLALYAVLQLANIGHYLLQIDFAHIIYALANIHQEFILRIPASASLGIRHILSKRNHRIF